MPPHHHIPLSGASCLELETNIREDWSFAIIEKAPSKGHNGVALKIYHPFLMIFVSVTQFHIYLPWITPI